MRYLILTLLLFFPSISYSAFNSMEILNIKPAGTGSPAIPSTNRIFFAYPGIEYNIRPGVLGGSYPFLYELTQAPAGMTIDSFTGEISWPNPTITGSPHSCAIRVTDQESTAYTASWQITVTDDINTFIFVDSAYSGTETGSITQPYSSLMNMLNALPGGNKLVYFRSGTYQYTGFGGNEMTSAGHPKTWLEYPEESVTINMNDTRIYFLSAPIYMDGLTFTNMDFKGLMVEGNISYHTVRRCLFDDYTNSNSGAFNQGILSALGSSGTGYFSVFQDNEFRNFTSSAGNFAAIGSLYQMKKLLIENNYIHSTLPGIYRGLMPKIGTSDYTFRGNKIIGNFDAIVNADPYSSMDGNEYNFNLFVTTNSNRGTVRQAFELIQGDTLFYRNTIIADPYIRDCSAGGPWSFDSNVISHSNTNFGAAEPTNYIYTNNAANCFTNINFLFDTTSSNLIDSLNEYKLQPAYSSSVGSVGWQLSDGSTPLEGLFILTETWYEDIDGDSYHSGNSQQSETDPGINWYKLSELLGGSDCNDNNASINPGASDLTCNGIDEDCSGADACVVCYKDTDGDLYSDGTDETVTSCSTNYYLAALLTAISGDCNDLDVSINPGAVDDSCDGIDQDCSGFDFCPAGVKNPIRTGSAIIRTGVTPIITN